MSYLSFRGVGHRKAHIGQPAWQGALQLPPMFLEKLLEFARSRQIQKQRVQRIVYCFGQIAEGFFFDRKVERWANSDPALRFSVLKYNPAYSA